MQTRWKGRSSPGSIRIPQPQCCPFMSFRQQSVNLLQILFGPCRFKRDLQQLECSHINLGDTRLLAVSTSFQPNLLPGAPPLPSPPFPALQISGSKTESEFRCAGSSHSPCSRPGSCFSQQGPSWVGLSAQPRALQPLCSSPRAPPFSLPFPENTPPSPHRSSARAIRTTSTLSIASTETYTPASSRSHGASHSWTPSSGSSPRALRSTR